MLSLPAEMLEPTAAPKKSPVGRVIAVMGVGIVVALGAIGFTATGFDMGRVTSSNTWTGQLSQAQPAPEAKLAPVEKLTSASYLVPKPAEPVLTPRPTLDANVSGPRAVRPRVASTPVGEPLNIIAPPPRRPAVSVVVAQPQVLAAADVDVVEEKPSLFKRMGRALPDADTLLTPFTFVGKKVGDAGKKVGDVIKNF